MRLSEIPAEVLEMALAARRLCQATIMREADGVVDWNRSHLRKCHLTEGHPGAHCDGERSW